MPSSVTVIVGTRKGCFLLESDGDRRAWEVRGPFCDGWPVYHAIHDAATGRALRSRRERVARVGRLAERGRRRDLALSSEGLSYGEGDELKLSKVSGLTAAHGRLLAGAEAAGVFSSSDGGDVVAPLDARRPARPRRWNDPAKQPPGHLGVPATLPHPDDEARFWAVVQGFGIFETTDDGASWTPRNRGLRADWPLEDPEVGYCVHKLVMSPVDTDRLYQQNHVGMHRSDDAGQSWVEITEGLPTSSASPQPRIPTTATRSTSSRSTLGTPGACPTGVPPSGARATPGRRGSGSTAASRSGTPTSASSARGWRSTRWTFPACTSGRAPARCSRAQTRARRGRRSRATCRRSRPSRSR